MHMILLIYTCVHKNLYVIISDLKFVHHAAVLSVLLLDKFAYSITAKTVNF